MLVQDQIRDSDHLLDETKKVWNYATHRFNVVGSFAGQARLLTDLHILAIVFGDKLNTLPKFRNYMSR